MPQLDAGKLAVDAFLSKADLLAQLLSHPAWRGFDALLRDMRQSALEELAQCADPAEFRYWQGAAAVLGDLLDRPREVVEAAAEHQRDEENEKNVLRPELRAAIGLGVDHDGDF